MTSINPPADAIPAKLPVIADPEGGTFCSPGCSQLPDADCQLRSYTSPKNALEWGYRPCPICRPMDVKDGSDSLKLLMDDIAVDPGFATKAQALIDRNLDPDRIRREFQRNYALSFQDYLRMRRINLRFGIPLGDSEAYNDDDVIFTRLGTPLGPILAAASAKGLCLLEFAERRMLETQIRRLEKYHSGRLLQGHREIFLNLNDQMIEYFDGKRKVFEVPLDLRGTAFQLSVWNELKKIPFGSVRSYGEQAQSLGNIRKVRAVAGANGDNPVSIIVPCHRVLGADGSMTGYGGRIWRKEVLLRLESDQKELF